VSNPFCSEAALIRKAAPGDARALAEVHVDCRCCFVVEHEGVPVGFVMAGPLQGSVPPFTGEVYAIYLRNAHQGRGWGKLMFDRAADWLRANGHEKFLLWVLPGNPTRGFYEARGGVAGPRKTIDVEGSAMEEIAYCWGAS
jgi:GNAT superfamily N-acetyltransferase